MVGECEPTCAAELFALQERGAVRFVDPNEVSSERFLTLLDEHELGEGETECLALLLDGGYVFCCDDGKARRVAAVLTDESRVVGSLRLLKWAVKAELCTTEPAFAYYQVMKDAGGILPEILPDWFQA